MASPNQRGASLPPPPAASLPPSPPPPPGRPPMFPPPIWTLGRLQAQRWGLGMLGLGTDRAACGAAEMPSPGKRKGISKRQKQNCQQNEYKVSRSGSLFLLRIPHRAPEKPCEGGKDPGLAVCSIYYRKGTSAKGRTVHTGAKYAAGSPRPRIPPPTRAGAARTTSRLRARIPRRLSMGSQEAR